MIICPSCQKSVTELGISGPVLYAEGIVEINPDDNKLIAISPLKAVQTLVAGSEITHPGMSLSCPLCKYTGLLGTFRVASMCVLTGVPTEFTVETDCGIVFVDRQFADEARRIFSEQNTRWDASRITSLEY